MEPLPMALIKMVAMRRQDFFPTSTQPSSLGHQLVQSPKDTLNSKLGDNLTPSSTSINIELLIT